MFVHSWAEASLISSFMHRRCIAQFAIEFSFFPFPLYYFVVAIQLLNVVVWGADVYGSIRFRMSQFYFRRAFFRWALSRVLYIIKLNAQRTLKCTWEFPISISSHHQIYFGDQNLIRPAVHVNEFDTNRILWDQLVFCSYIRTFQNFSNGNFSKVFSLCSRMRRILYSFSLYELSLPFWNSECHLTFTTIDCRLFFHNCSER